MTKLEIHRPDYIISAAPVTTNRHYRIEVVLLLRSSVLCFHSSGPNPQHEWTPDPERKPSPWHGQCGVRETALNMFVAVSFFTITTRFSPRSLFISDMISFALKALWIKKLFFFLLFIHFTACSNSYFIEIYSRLLRWCVQPFFTPLWHIYVTFEMKEERREN